VAQQQGELEHFQMRGHEKELQFYTLQISHLEEFLDNQKIEAATDATSSQSQ
jgi:hypothetical protein